MITLENFPPTLIHEWAGPTRGAEGVKYTLSAPQQLGQCTTGPGRANDRDRGAHITHAIGSQTERPPRQPRGPRTS
eukprot:1494569-Prymnesium_polylepis.1